MGAPHSWAPVAERLGLARWAEEYRGLVEGRVVVLSKEGRRTRLEATFEPPLDLKLRIPGRWGDIQVPSTESGKANKMRILIENVAAEEPARSEALLTVSLRDAIRTLLEDCPGVATYLVSDDGVRLEGAGTVRRLDWIEAKIEAVARVARLVDEARGGVPCARELRGDLARVHRLATERGFERLTTPLGLRGVVEGLGVAAHAVSPLEGRRALRWRVVFPQPLSLGLDVCPGDTPRVFRWLGSEDWSTEDPAFDVKFTVRTTEPQALAGVLDPIVRARVLDLANEGLSVAIGDEEIVVEGVPWQVWAPKLGGVLDRVLALARQLLENMGRDSAKPLGPYR